MKNLFFSHSIKRSISAVTLSAITLVSFANVIPQAYAAEGAPVVTIMKYMDGVPATTMNAGGADFNMTATWNDPAGIGSGTGAYQLSDSTDPAYQAQTVAFASGADYSTSEVIDGTMVGTSCDSSQSFSLMGYSWGTTLGAAQAMTPTMTAPSFTGMTGDMFVIVWNHDCAVPVTPETVQVTIHKYIDGIAATATTTGTPSFSMISTTTAANLNGGVESSGTYSLDSAGSYMAMTSEMDSGANYATNEIMNSTTAMNCDADEPYMLTGYTWGTTMGAAAMMTPTTTAPSFMGLTEDMHVIVWNHDCSTSSGTIGGDVTGTPPAGALAVTSITPGQTNATADNTFTNGLSYTFNITVPSNEPNVAMKFADWMNTTASSTMPTANNMRISSAQADNSGATVLLTAANTYSSPALHITGDLNPAMPGMQVQILVEVKIPANTVNGLYTTSYGVQTQP